MENATNFYVVRDAINQARLQYAHYTVIHRDIKPGNILLDPAQARSSPSSEDFEPVLTDFGLVRFLDLTEHTTGSGQIAGTPARPKFLNRHAVSSPMAAQISIRLVLSSTRSWQVIYRSRARLRWAFS